RIHPDAKNIGGAAFSRLYPPRLTARGFLRNQLTASDSSTELLLFDLA
ncbi:MAG: hypothetical protein HLUCCO16_17980, partial [Phormidium sp. OSCR]